MRSKFFLPLAAAVFAFASTAQAGVVDNPASLLLYPEYDSNPGVLTLLTVTNTNSSATTGTVEAHFIFVNEVNCGEFNRSEILTPNDTFTTVAGPYNPNAQRGYVYVYARNRQTHRAISFNYLIGIESTLNGLEQFNYSFNPFNFRAIGAEGTLTDVDNDGVRDLNGVEYEAAPAEIQIPNFLGQTAARISNLILINLAGNLPTTTTTVNFLVYNNEEDTFSAQYTFDCWAKVPLLTINGVFSNSFLATSGDGLLDTAGLGITPGPHPVTLGAPSLETGWMRLRGAVANVNGSSQILNPAILAVLTEAVASFQMADLPYGIGTNTTGGLPGFLD
jgi:hypothetical protein